MDSILPRGNPAGLSTAKWIQTGFEPMADSSFRTADSGTAATSVPHKSQHAGEPECPPEKLAVQVLSPCWLESRRYQTLR